MSGHKSVFDNLDLEIISHLQDDGRKSFREIAEQVGVTERTIRLRVAQLRETDVLQIVGVVNPIEFGLQVSGIVQLSVEEAKLEECIALLRDIVQVRFITLTSGEFQLLAQVIAKSYQDLSRFMREDLARLPGIRKTNTTVQLEVLKNDFRLVRKELIQAYPETQATKIQE
jgi:Lrp/AsnC family transcriptional regulator for asnA, asnC and gidA